MSDTPEPLPCPFCGSPAKTFWFDGALQATCPRPYVECAASDVVAPVAMWNRRAASPEVQALIREAEEKERAFWVKLSNELVDKLEALEDAAAAHRKDEETPT